MLRSFSDIKNFALAATDGEIGKVKELYFDDLSWTIRYVVVDTGGWLTGRKVLIAPRSFGTIHEENKLIAVHLTKEQIENSPPIEADKSVSRRFEEQWYAHYGYPGYWLGPEAVAFGGLPPAGPTATATDAAREARVEESGDPHLRSTSEVDGYSIHATDGDIGHVDDFIIDDEAWSIRYVVVSRGWLGKKVILSPQWIERVSWEEGKVFVSLTREAIKNAPEWDDVQPITRDFEERLHAHHGRDVYWPTDVLK